MKYGRHLFLFVFILFLAFFVSTVNALEISYTYDSLDRLTSAIYKEGFQTTSLSYQYDAVGNMLQCTVTLTSDMPQCSQCSQDPLFLNNTTFTSGTLCECTAATSITVGSGVTVQKDATVIFRSPKVYVKPGAHFANGANVEIKQQ